VEEKHIFRLALITVFIGLISLFLVSEVFSIPLQTEGPFIVTYVVDGDTLDLENGDRIRFSGINTPETGECYYEEAKKALANLVLGKEVSLEKDFTDEGKYGRKLRYVYYEKILVNEYLVSEGFAKVYDKYNESTKRYSELKEVEAVAIAEKKGLWGCVDPKEGCLYVASKNSKIYHEPHCKWAKKIKAENMICFHSEDELEGYEPAKSC
jgi:micrococcal nuclease